MATNSQSRDSNQRGARGNVISRGDKWRGYRYHHRSTLQTSLQKMLREPFQSLLTIVVIAIALTLPTALSLGIDNMRQLSGGIEASAQISVFVKKGARPAAVEEMASQLKKIVGRCHGYTYFRRVCARGVQDSVGFWFGASVS